MRVNAVDRLSLILSGLGMGLLGSRNYSFSSRKPIVKARYGFSKALRASFLQLSPLKRSFTCASYGGNSIRRNYNEEFNHESFWVSMIKDVARDFRSLVLFLIEQPSQLKYIEWPSFQTTLKTAILTLVLVAALIVALSAVDAALSYTLALFLDDQHDFASPDSNTSYNWNHLRRFCQHLL